MDKIVRICKCNIRFTYKKNGPVLCPTCLDESKRKNLIWHCEVDGKTLFWNDDLMPIKNPFKEINLG